MVESQNNPKKMMWTTLAMMAFSTVWGFGNVVNGYVYFDGTKVIFSWVGMFLLYFVPYALMVGELGATFKNAEGGVSSWVNATMGAKWAYYAGWTYWACHVVYISSKGTGGLRAMAWGILWQHQMVRRITYCLDTICNISCIFILLLGSKSWYSCIKGLSNYRRFFNVHHVNFVYHHDVCRSGY